MKIRNKDRKYDIEEIFISKFENKTKVIIVINGQAITMFVSSTYSSVVFEKIEEYLQVLGSDNEYVRI